MSHGNARIGRSNCEATSELEQEDREEVVVPQNLKSRSMQEYLDNSLYGLAAATRIFAGCCIFVNGDTTPTRYEIQRLVVLHGGRFDAYKTSRTTHFLCDHFPNTKLTELSKNHPRIRLRYVTAAWFVQSIGASRRLDEAEFTPRGLQQGQRKLAFEGSGGGSVCDESAGSSELSPSGGGGVCAFHPDRTLATGRHSSPAADSSSPQAVCSSRDARSAAAPSYMQQFYGASRLHFIGTWRSRLPALMEELERERRAGAAAGVTQQYELERFALGPGETEPGCESSSIVHIDMDCFFVAVLIRERPELWTRPVAVAHSSSAGSSEVSSCNYPARALGVTAGMFMKQARALCPALTVLRYDFAQYEAVSKQLYKLCLAFSAVVQPVSVDELYVECAPGHHVEAAVQHLRAEIFRQTGVGKNKLLARLGTAKAKPNGLFVVPCGPPTPPSCLSPTLQFMATVPLKALPGVGRKLRKKLMACTAGKSSRSVAGAEAEAADKCREICLAEGVDVDESGDDDGDDDDDDGKEAPLGGSIEFCADLWAVPLSTLAVWVGGAALAKNLHEACRGRDLSQLKSMREIADGRKSVGAEVNYGHRYETDALGTAMQKAERFLLNLCEEVVRRLAQAQVCGYCVTVKLMKRNAAAAVVTRKYMGHGACDNTSKSQTLSTSIGKTGGGDSHAAAAVAALSRAALGLFRSMVSSPAGVGTFPPEDIRGMGVQVTRLEKTTCSSSTRSGSSSSSSSSSSSGSSSSGDQLRMFFGGGRDSAARQEGSSAGCSSGQHVDFAPASPSAHSTVGEPRSTRAPKRKYFDNRLGHSSEDCFGAHVLSNSQIDFVRSVPLELRGEVLQQMSPRAIQSPPDKQQKASAPAACRGTEHSGLAVVLDAVDTGRGEDRPRELAASGVPPAPSMLLPHRAHSCAELRGVLASWAALEELGPTPRHTQALTSYAIWLVRSKQLDKARALARLLRRVGGEQDGCWCWEEARRDVEAAIQLACQLLHGCLALL